MRTSFFIIGGYYMKQWFDYVDQGFILGDNKVYKPLVAYSHAL